MFRWRDVLILSATLMVTVACDTKDDEEEDDTTGLPGLDDTETTPSDYGPENSWWHAAESDVPGDLEGTGYGEGDVAYNFLMQDQNGDEVELYQFYGQVILLDVYAEW